MNNTSKNGTTAIKKVRIYQIYSVESEYLLKNYAYVKKQKRAAPPAELYEVVFDGQLGTDNLRDIFRIFNAEQPVDYNGRSLTVSDIVELYDDINNLFFYCDSDGFKKIRFKPVKIQYMLLAQNERDLENIQIFKTITEAQRVMKNELLEKLHGSFDNYDEDEDYGLYATSAWSNPGSNWDWIIIRLTLDKNLNIKTDFITGR